MQMMVLLTLLVAASGLSFFILSAVFFLFYKSLAKEESLSPFESGFNPKLLVRSNFSLQFFLVGVIFILFDVELVMLFPFVFLGAGAGMLQLWLYLSGIFLIFGGLAWEWNLRSLNWTE